MTFYGVKRTDLYSEMLPRLVYLLVNNATRHYLDAGADQMRNNPTDRWRIRLYK